MADISNLKIGENTYAIKDKSARQSSLQAQQTADDAEAKADTAISDSASAKTTADTALNNAKTAQSTADGAMDLATEADNKISNAKIIGEYASNTETLDIKLQLGEAV